MTHPLLRFAELASQDPDALAVIQGDHALGRADLIGRAGALAQGLSLASGARVLVQLPNSPDMMALVLAIWAQGGLPMFLSAKSPATHLDAIIARHAPAHVIDIAALEALPAGQASLDLPVLPGDADASVVFTSGSTGMPKGVVQKAATLTSGADRVARVMGYGPSERILVPVPFAHDYGWGQMLSCFIGGHTLILPSRDSLVDISRTISRDVPTVLAGVPSLFAGLLHGISDFENSQTDSLRIVSSTGSPFAPALYAALRTRLPDVRILRNFGLTETYRSCCLPPEMAQGEADSAGRPIEGVTIAIAGPDGRPLPADQEGEVVHLGAGVFDRYLDDPDATARSRRTCGDLGIGVFTGDIGRLDQDGFLHLAGRRDRLVKSMDIRLNLSDVEAALTALAMVTETAVIARPNPMSGVELVAFCTARPDITAPDIRRAANRALPAHMRPREITVLDALPRTPVGKTDYPALANWSASTQKETL
ncbi:class I adenylate-forming enzyme family protein [Paracoccus tegillarcae]|uniref:Acyl-CoA synthetase (AMP-forming)/AMP-acid ligase II n=1 Tax=Paracoccus tegillarcae TaxID=1529068 RepID=A0A2K9EZG3_9RHOB|nr:AMP-binding protein [Paracoccus tegillarcae]AUH32281.1 hypothetical protein CUV01_01705 [Paracoccus tegillarcae]